MERLSFKRDFDSLCEVSEVINQIYDMNRKLFPYDFRSDVFLSYQQKSKKNKICNFSFYKTEKTTKNFEILENNFSEILKKTKVNPLT